MPQSPSYNTFKEGDNLQVIFQVSYTKHTKPFPHTLIVKMAPQKTRQWILDSPPAKDIILEGNDATFKLETTELPEPGKDQVLVKTL